jgi:Bacterial regulatory helix-turn-helix protein, lysR family
LRHEREKPSAWRRVPSRVKLTDIAADLGLNPETVRRNLVRFGITGRQQDVAGMPSHGRVHPGLPDEIRRVVEGPHHGWLRLRRFQQIIAYPSLNTAAKGLGTDLSTLTNQVARLEADIGKPLLHRGRPNRPMRPTEHGQALLELLQQPQIAQLLDQWAKPLRGWRHNDPHRHRPPGKPLSTT